jgi:hypothetical protein
MPKLQAGLKENRFYRYPIKKQADEKNTPACFSIPYSIHNWLKKFHWHQHLYPVHR